MEFVSAKQFISRSPHLPSHADDVEKWTGALALNVFGYKISSGLERQDLRANKLGVQRTQHIFACRFRISYEI